MEILSCSTSTCEITVKQAAILVQLDARPCKDFEHVRNSMRICGDFLAKVAKLRYHGGSLHENKISVQQNL